MDPDRNRRAADVMQRVGDLDIPKEFFAIVMRVVDDKIAHAVEYATKGEALEAVGLSE